MVVTRFLGSFNLILKRDSHEIGFCDLKLAHDNLLFAICF
jgi:hypothetical protein